MRAELERMRELDREHQQIIADLLKSTRQLIDDSNTERATIDALDD